MIANDKEDKSSSSSDSLHDIFSKLLSIEQSDQSMKILKNITVQLHEESTRERVDESVLALCLSHGAQLKLLKRDFKYISKVSSALHEIFDSRRKCVLEDGLEARFNCLKLLLQYPENFHALNDFQIIRSKYDSETGAVSGILYETELKNCQTAFCSILKAVCANNYFSLVEACATTVELRSELLLFCCKEEFAVNPNALFFTPAPWNHWAPTWHLLLEVEWFHFLEQLMVATVGRFDIDARRFGFMNNEVDTSDTALHHLIMMCSTENELERSRLLQMVEILLLHGADPNAISLDLTIDELTGHRNRVAETGLHMALKIGFVSLVQLLLKSGADYSYPLLECDIEKFPKFSFHGPFHKDSVLKANVSIDEAYKTTLKLEESAVRKMSCAELLKRSKINGADKRNLLRLFKIPTENMH